MRDKKRCGQNLSYIYALLDSFFGDLHWWPGDTAFEVIIGAILTQNTAWRNVEIAIAELKSNGLLDPEMLMRSEEELLQRIIKPSGYYRVKARRIKSFLRFLFERYRGSLQEMFAEDAESLRQELLQINGIGEETADSILLYGGNKPTFVVDAYTRRILERHRLIEANTSYAEIQNLFTDHLPKDVSLYKQYHALFVNTGKLFCQKMPRCDQCPLGFLNGSLARLLE
jgi:endonuclease-3 related protein